MYAIAVDVDKRKDIMTDLIYRICHHDFMYGTGNYKEYAAGLSIERQLISDLTALSDSDFLHVMQATFYRSDTRPFIVRTSYKDFCAPFKKIFERYEQLDKPRLL